ncbi:MAG: MerR family transcriptional regulator [Actinobacteria bacterium]|jgi:DNA-binding transcriptional MerR regulator|nr:MerR family transcriptional regulator [Actinomycetota bacterium]
MSDTVDSRDAIQSDLFGAPADERELTGFRSPVACSVAGITYRQLDYWARTGLVEPTVRDVNGSGNQRLYGFRDILMLKVVKRLLDAGVSLQNIRAAVTYLGSRAINDLGSITLMSDGVSVYECTSDDELVDLVRQGQGVFGIAVGQVWAEISGSLSLLPAQPGGDVEVQGTDELSLRRLRRIS